ncbi:MAG: hypothetical protein R2771_03790 [Saprospiraceae bacterium]
MMLAVGCEHPIIPPDPTDLVDTTSIMNDTIFELIWERQIDTIEGTMSQSEKQIWKNQFLTTVLLKMKLQFIHLIQKQGISCGSINMKED